MTDATSPDSVKEMETVTSADGTEIAFDRTGNGPPLVLVHGGGDVHEFWNVAGTLSAFADHFTVYVIDRRGRGQSGDADAYALEREAEDVAAVVDTIDEPVVLLGHSSGAIYTLEAALRTDNLQKLVLHEPPITVGDHELEAGEVVTEIRRLLDDGENEQALVLFRREVAGLTSEETDELRSKPLWQDMVGAAHTLPRELETIPEYEFDATRFGDLITPTLVLSGGDSPPLFKDAAEAITDALPNSRHAIIDGHGHEVMNTAPDRFVDEVLTFIRKPN